MDHDFNKFYHQSHRRPDDRFHKRPRGQRDQVMDPLERILWRVQRSGYHTTIERMGSYVQVRAVPASGKGDTKIVRCERDDYASLNQCVVALAEMCNIAATED